MSSPTAGAKPKFTRYHIFIIAILAFIQFTVILDFMVLSPLGVILLKEFNITASQFSLVVSAYAISAGLSGLLAAGFADKFDRKKLLLFFYVGFIIGTLLCGLAPTYHFLLAARIVTGIFGGVIGSISFAIITDLFPLEVRGRVMGFVQMAFASSQVLGLPVGMALANHWGWHSPFILIVGVAAFVGIFIAIYMKPVTAHLQLKNESSALSHFGKTISDSRYLKVFAATILLATGGFMMMPFGSAFTVNNQGIDQHSLPTIYFITGISALITGPLVGYLADKVGRYTVFLVGSLLGMTIAVIYCNLGITPLHIVIMLNVLMFIGISSRMISSSTIVSAIPEPKDRGAFMGINSSLQQISGGIAAYVAGLIVFVQPDGKLQHYDTLGYVVVGTMTITIIMMYFINLQVLKKVAATKAAAAPAL